MALVVEAIGDLARRGRQRPAAGRSTCRQFPDDWLASPDFGTLGEFSLIGSFEEAGVVTALLFVFTLLLADFFDTMGTMTAIGAEAGLLDEDGKPPNTERILVVDSLAAAAGGAAGVSSNTQLHRVRRRASARAPAPGWRPWSPACSSCSPSCSPRSWRWSRPRPPYRRWCWWAS